MSKFYKVVGGGNYKIQVDTGNKIILDTGSTGTVEIEGDLTVNGTMTTVNTTDLEITDNLILLNNGETGSGITLNYSGIKIDRGSATNGDVELVFDENIGNWYESRLNQNNSDGVFAFRYSDNPNRIIALRVYDIDTNGENLNLIGGGTGTVQVKETINYEEQVFYYQNGVIDSTKGAVRITETFPLIQTENTDDVIPNAKAVVDFVQDSIQSITASTIGEGDTSVTVRDQFDYGGVVEITVDGQDFQPQGQPDANIIDGVREQRIKAVFSYDQTDIEGLTIRRNLIETRDTGDDLVLRAATTNTVKIDDVLEITQTPSDQFSGIDPAAPDTGVKIYSKPRGSGDSGIYFANTKDGTVKRDELVSKSKAILFGILF
jgi:hypothetical protein